MNDDFSKYEAMQRSGVSAENVYLEAVRDRIDPITRIRLIRIVFCLTPRQAKEIIVRAEGEAESLDRHQANIAKKLTAEPGLQHSLAGGCPDKEGIDAPAP